jgi:hypothetical protein
MFVVSFSAMPFTEWFSSDLGSPRTRSFLAHDVPFQVSRVTTPEFVSRLRSPRDPPPNLGSLDETYTTGAAAVPVTSMPVAWRHGLVHALAWGSATTAPVSLWFAIVLMDVTVCVAVTA